MKIWKELIYWISVERDEYHIHTDFEMSERDIRDLSKIKGLEGLEGMLKSMHSINSVCNDYRVHLEASIYLPKQYRKSKNIN